jgi:hypothetical protein
VMPGMGAPEPSYTVPNTTAFWACKAGAAAAIKKASNKSRKFLLIAVLLWDQRNQRNSHKIELRT